MGVPQVVDAGHAPGSGAQTRTIEEPAQALAEATARASAQHSELAQQEWRVGIVRAAAPHAQISFLGRSSGSSCFNLNMRQEMPGRRY